MLLLLCLQAQELLTQNFKAEQKNYIRVRNAYQEKENVLKREFLQAGLSYPPSEVFIRIFKYERTLELWTRSMKSDSFKLFKEYKICVLSGELGPKRKQGDCQVPEGFYYVDTFNPASSFHLSMRINYPNESDRILGIKGKLGGNICIHGDCVTIGCIPITDNHIKEVYLLAIEARSSGQNKIPVHIFPARFKDGTQTLQNYSQNKKLNAFWMNLRTGYDYFEKYKKLPIIRVAKDGKYQFN
ncbi:MAG: hypothetical protein JXA06_13085 [Bacteroidetes bacterium]|nr:hypothetical protein [Bacteroidota bacterium]